MNRYGARTAVLAMAVGIFGAALKATPARAQAEVPVKVTINIGGRTETLRGTGQCGHEPRASIYGADAALWMAEYSEAGHEVSLTYWRLVGDTGGQQFSLSVQSGSRDHRINTVKGGTMEGSGRSTFQPTALGGRFEINGKDQTGAALSISIECARFGSISAVGG